MFRDQHDGRLVQVVELPNHFPGTRYRRVSVIGGQSPRRVAAEAKRDEQCQSAAQGKC